MGDRGPPKTAGLFLLGLIVAAAPVAGAGAAPGAEPVVRVLLIETGEAVYLRDGSEVTRLVAAPDGLLANARPVGKRFRLAGGGPLRAGDLRVRGSLEVRWESDGLQVVNRVGLEDYVAGTLGREVYTDWHAETLKAQAVVARTYALHHMARRARDSYDLARGTTHQVYGGFDAETASVVAAAAATRGEYLAYGNEPILAVYHSASGGRTASAEEVWGQARPYLVSVVVENEEDSPDTYWRAAVSRTTLRRALDSLGFRVGPVREARVAARSASGRALRVEVRGARGKTSVEARALRPALGADAIRRTLFEIRRAPEGFIFVGSGHGHGVGMSQWGAQAMAKRGADYREILATFYPATDLVSERSR
jgi:stage II sporulation protein D